MTSFYLEPADDKPILSQTPCLYIDLPFDANELSSAATNPFSRQATASHYVLPSSMSQEGASQTIYVLSQMT